MALNAKEIGKRIQNLRNLKGLTQQELADEIGYTLSMVGKVESGARIPAIDMFVVLAEYFCVSLDFIVLGK